MRLCQMRAFLLASLTAPGGSPHHCSGNSCRTLMQRFSTVTAELSHQHNPGWLHAKSEPRSRRISSLMIAIRSEEHTSELQSLMSITYAVFCLKKKILANQ